MRFQFWNLDDGVLCGSVDVIARALTLLQAELPKLGLCLNISKCKLFGPACQTADPIFAGIPRASVDEGSIVLGIPIGGDDFVKFIDESKMQTMLAKLCALNTRVAKFLLLRACFGACRVNHHLRSLDFQHGKVLAQNSSALFREMLNDLLGSPCTDVQFKHACLPGRRGGLGLRNPNVVHGPAYLAAQFSFAQTSEDLPAVYWSDLAAAWCEIQESFQLANDDLALFDGTAALNAEDIPSL